MYVPYKLPLYKEPLGAFWCIRGYVHTPQSTPRASLLPWKEILHEQSLPVPPLTTECFPIQICPYLFPSQNFVYELIGLRMTEVKLVNAPVHETWGCFFLL